MKISFSIMLSVCCFVCSPRGRLLPSAVLKEPDSCNVVMLTPEPAWLTHSTWKNGLSNIADMQ